MKKKVFVLLTLMMLCANGCEIRQETEESKEIVTEEKKVSEIVTEVKTERKTEKRIENTRKRTETHEHISTTEERTEEHTGEVDVNGYGWVQLQYSAAYNICENHLTRSNGVVYFAGHKETWYSTNEAAGQATAREIPGKHVADDGTIRDADGYICVASSDLLFYSIVMTSVGPGKVYDCGCSYGTIDVYTIW